MDSIALRDLAHELRQPLSTIEAIAYYLTLVLPRDDEKTHEQLDRLQRLVEQSNWILSNSLHLSEMATPAPERIDLEEMIAELAASHSVLRLELGGDCLVHADPGLLRVLMDNLVTLFRQIACDDHPAILRTSARDGRVVLEIETAAPGFRSIAGGSLSLACARSMVEAHGGSMEVRAETDRVRLQVVLT
jgi:signal transduction histidine kinase